MSILTTNAIGIHDHPTRKLGLRPPANKPALKLSSFLKAAAIPSHPIVANHLVAPPTGQGALDFGLYGNDRYGDCGPVSVANLYRLLTRWLTGNEVRKSQDDVFNLYRASGNPSFDPATDADDNGVSMQIMLEALNRVGIGGAKCLAFARVDPRQTEEMRAAIAIFGGVLLGVTLEVAQQRQAGVWQYKPSSVWGGHAVLCGAYDRRSTFGDLRVITWAENVLMSRAFVDHQVDECWVVIWPENLGSQQFLQGIDVAALKRDYQALTGRTF